jgi:hypothetical protein
MSGAAHRRVDLPAQQSLSDVPPHARRVAGGAPAALVLASDSSRGERHVKILLRCRPVHDHRGVADDARDTPETPFSLSANTTFHALISLQGLCSRALNM